MDVVKSWCPECKQGKQKIISTFGTLLNDNCRDCDGLMSFEYLECGCVCENENLGYNCENSLERCKCIYVCHS